MNHEPLELMNHEPHELSESVQSQKNTKNAKDGARLPHSWEEKAGVRASKFGRAALLRGPNIRAAQGSTALLSINQNEHRRLFR